MTGFSKYQPKADLRFCFTVRLRRSESDLFEEESEEGRNCGGCEELRDRLGEWMGSNKN